MHGIRPGLDVDRHKLVCLCVYVDIRAHALFKDGIPPQEHSVA